MDGVGREVLKQALAGSLAHWFHFLLTRLRQGTGRDGLADIGVGALLALAR